MPVPFNLLSIPLLAICRQCQKCICRRFHESSLDESGRVSYNFTMRVSCGELMKHKTLTTTTTGRTTVLINQPINKPKNKQKIQSQHQQHIYNNSNSNINNNNKYSAIPLVLFLTAYFFLFSIIFDSQTTEYKCITLCFRLITFKQVLCVVKQIT